MEFSSMMYLLELSVLILLYVAVLAMFLDSVFKGTIFLVLARKVFNEAPGFGLSLIYKNLLLWATKKKMQPK